MTIRVSELKRKKGESFEAFIRRVKNQQKMSGKILQAKKIQFFESKKSKNVKKNLTVKKLKDQQKTAYLQKTGRLPVEETPHR